MTYFILRSEHDIWKIKKPALAAMIAGAVLLVFSLTPLFPLTLSNFRSVEKEIPLNTPLPPPSIFAVYPSPPLKWQQTGNIELIGLNLISHGGKSSLLWGDKADALTADETASFEPSKVSISMKPVTKKSGTYYFKIIRKDDDGKTVAVGGHHYSPRLGHDYSPTYLRWKRFNLVGFGL